MRVLVVAALLLSACEKRQLPMEPEAELSGDSASRGTKVAPKTKKAWAPIPEDYSKGTAKRITAQNMEAKLAALEAVLLGKTPGAAPPPRKTVGSGVASAPGESK